MMISTSLNYLLRLSVVIGQFAKALTYGLNITTLKCLAVTALQ